MKRVQNYVPNQLVAAADLNAIQDFARGTRRATKDTELVDWVRPNDGVIFQMAASTIGAGAGEIVDDDRDWRNHLVQGWIATPGSSTQRINGANAYNINGAFEGAFRFIGFLGTGSTTAFGGTEYFIRPDWDGAAWTWNLYADTATGALRIWNRSGAAARLIIHVESIGREP